MGKCRLWVNVFFPIGSGPGGSGWWNGVQLLFVSRHLPIASIGCDTWSIRYLIVVAYGYLSRENWDLIEAMGKCRLWVNVAWVNVAMGICRMGICRLTVLSLICLSKPSSFTEDLAYHLKLLPCLYTVENKLSRVKGFQSLGFDKTIS